MLPAYDNDTLSVHSKKSLKCNGPANVRRSLSLYSERHDKKEPPFVLSVDFSTRQPAGPGSANQIYDIAQHPHDNYPYILDQKANYDGFPDLSSMCSNNSLATIHHPNRELTPTFPVLPHIRSSLGQPSMTASNLVLQMEHERERGNLSRCLKLAQEREALEQELLRHSLERGSMRKTKKEQLDFDIRRDGIYDFMWEYKSSTLPHRYPQSGKKSSGVSRSRFSSSSVPWEDLNSPPALISATPTRFNTSNHRPAQSITRQTPLRFENAGSFSKDRLPLPHLSPMHQTHESVEAAPEGCDNSAQSTMFEMQTNDSFSEARRQNNLSHGSLSALSFHSNKYTERSNLTLDAVPDSSNAEVVFSWPPDEDVCVEMSVDEPELEICVMRPTKPMLHQRIASHVQQGGSLTGRRRYEAKRRSTNFNYCSPASVEDITTHQTSLHSEPEHQRSGSKQSKIWDSKQRSQSLDLRRQKESNFLTPDAWVDSLSQENCSVASSRHPDALIKETQRSAIGRLSKSPAKSPSAVQASSHSPPTVDSPSPRSISAGPISNPEVPRHYKPRGDEVNFQNAAKWPITYHQKAVKEAEGYLEAGTLPPDHNDNDALEVEAQGYEGVPESGGSYSSYASSGRGSMEPTNGRLSVCPLSPNLSISPETVEESQGNAEDTLSHRMEPRQRY